MRCLWGDQGFPPWAILAGQKVFTLKWLRNEHPERQKTPNAFLPLRREEYSRNPTKPIVTISFISPGSPVDYKKNGLTTVTVTFSCLFQGLTFRLTMEKSRQKWTHSGCLQNDLGRISGGRTTFSGLERPSESIHRPNESPSRPGGSITVRVRPRPM